MSNFETATPSESESGPPSLNPTAPIQYIDDAIRPENEVHMRRPGMDPRRPDKIVRYSDKGRNPASAPAPGARLQAEIEMENELTPDYVAVLSLIASTLCLAGSVKWLSWVALYCAFVAFAKAKYKNPPPKVRRVEITSSILTALFALFISYFFNPTPLGAFLISFFYNPTPLGVEIKPGQSTDIQ